MNSLIETLNQFGGQFFQFAWPMLWQSSLLIAVVLALDFLLARKIRAAIRYALWLAVLVKLLLPPTLALPTGAVWWLFHEQPAVKAPAIKNYTVTYDTTPLADYVPPTVALPPPPSPQLNGAGWTLLATGVISVGLLLWLVLRWWQVTRMVRGATTSENLADLMEAVRRQAGLRSRIRVKLVEGRMSPAVCGLFCPVILLPRTLAEKLSPTQLRAVLLHEVFHLRRKDVWVNCAQALLQIIYWWHPLLWVANARIRRVREEAVDDAVMLALCDEADSYAPTLLEVAKLAFRRPLMSLGLVGIMESRSALRQRIERLVDFRAPRKAGLTLASLCGICVFSAVALPMGEAPATAEKPFAADTIKAKSEPERAMTFRLFHPEGEDVLKGQLLEAGVKIPPTIIHDFNNGILFARGTREQLVLIEQTVLKLNGYSVQEAAADTNIPDYAIKIPVDEPATARLYSRNFRVSRDVVYANLPKQTGTQSNTLDSTNVSVAFRELFTEMGLNLESPPGKSIFYNEKLGKLFTKATASDLDVIECAVEGLMAAAPPQTNGNDSSPVGATKVIGIVNAYPATSGQNTATRSAGAKAKAGDLVQDGKLLYEMGKLDDAEVKLKQAQELDPDNTRASYYLNLIQQTKFARESAQHTADTNVQMPQVDKQWVLPASKVALPNANADGTNKLVWTGPGRQAIIYKLDHIRLDNVSFDNLPLSEVLRILAKQSKLRDPEHAGINFLLDLNPDKPGQTIDPATGLPTSADNSEPVDVGSFIVKIPKLTNVRLADVLDAIVTVCDHPIQYSIRDFAVVFSVKEPETPQLFSRVFKIDTNIFYSLLQFSKNTNSPALISAEARKFFTGLGVDLESPKGKSVYYNERLGRLFVKATESDLDTIGRALSALNQVAPQIHIKARFVEVPKGTLSGLPKMVASTNRLVQSNQLASITGILTDENFKIALRNLEARDGVENLAEPEVTTTSGRQTQMRATQVVTVITNMAFYDVFTNQDGLVVSNSIVPQTSQVETGPILDVVPYVLSDGYTIYLTLIPSLTEFLGYDKPTNSSVAYNRAGEKIDVPRVLPRFATQQTVATLNLWDGQTVIIGGMTKTNTNVIVDKVPVLGDLPLRGPLFSSTKTKKEVVEDEILVFVTATIVDRAGNRVHSDADLPFAQMSVPPQPAPK